MKPTKTHAEGRNLMALNLKFDDNVPADLRTLAPVWLDEVTSWLMSQPRTGVDGEYPAFEELRFTVGMDFWNRGLRRKSSGDGWQHLGLSNLMVLETRPRHTVIETTMELASKVRWVYLLSQLFRGENYFDEDFRQLEHYNYQLKYFQEVAPDEAKTFANAQRANRLKNQKVEKHQLQMEMKRKRRQPQQLKRYKPVYSPAPKFVPAPLPPPREPAPSPELNEFEALAVARHKAMYEFIEQEAAKTCSIH